MELMERIAIYVAHLAAENRRLSDAEKAALLREHYDTAYAAMMLWDEASSRIRHSET